MADIFVAPAKNKLKSKQTIIKSHMHSLSSFAQEPKDVSFQTQKEKEYIILFLRSHFITNLSWIFITLVLIALPSIVFAFLSNFGLDFLSPVDAKHFTVIFVLLYYLLVFSYMFVSFLHWFYNVFIVTSERVVDIDYSDIVIHNIAIASLSHVQDVNYSQSGFISTFFNYGDIFVQTAGDEKNFEAYSVPKPREATHIIGDLTGIK
jgi:hypothetical protein